MNILLTVTIRSVDHAYNWVMGQSFSGRVMWPIAYRGATSGSKFRGDVDIEYSLANWEITGFSLL